MAILENYNVEVEDLTLGELYPTKKAMNDDMQGIANRGYCQPREQYVFSADYIAKPQFMEHQEIGTFGSTTTKVYDTTFKSMYETNKIRHNFCLLKRPTTSTSSIYNQIRLWSFPLNPVNTAEYDETLEPNGYSIAEDYQFVKSFNYNECVYKPTFTFAKIDEETGIINTNYYEGTSDFFRSLDGLREIVESNREDLYLDAFSWECALWNKNSNEWNYGTHLIPMIYGFNEVNCLQGFGGLFSPESFDIPSNRSNETTGLLSSIALRLKTHYYDYYEGTNRRTYASNLNMISSYPEFTFVPFDLDNYVNGKTQILQEDEDSIFIATQTRGYSTYITYTFRRLLKPKFVYKKLAELGLYMTSRKGVISGNYELFCGTTPPNELMNRDDTYLGEMLDGGITTGNFLRGSEIVNSRTPNKSGSNVDIDYKPSFDVSAEDSIATQYRGISVHSSYFLKYYLMTQQNMINFSNEIKLAYGDEIFNVQDYIVSILEIPRLYLSNAVISTTENIKIANWEYQTAQGGLLSYNLEEINLGSLLIERHHYNFLDYEPYTTLMLYVPFCGMVTLPTDFVMGHKITLYGHCDFETGHLIVEIYCRGGLVTSIEGNCSRVVTFSASSSIQKIMGVVGSISQLGVDIINTVKNPFMLSALPADINNIAESIGTNYITLSKGKGTSSSFAMTNMPCLYRYTTVKTNQDGFKKSVGNRCERFSRLNELTGLTVCQNPIINVTATDVERTEIYEALQRGVIL